MRNILLILCVVFALSANAQDIERTVVNGRIVVSSEDKEGVTVFNSSSNKGTITDENGSFKIDVALNDTVEFGALQFKNFKVTITQNIITTKKITVILVEEVNKLDEVVILPFNLTGNLNPDLDNVRTYNVDLDAIYFGLDHISDFEFSADYKTKINNLAFNEYNPRMDNMLNIVNIAGFLIKEIIGDKNSKPKDKKEKAIEKTSFKKALDQYSFNYIHTNFNIPLNQIDAFIIYMETQGVNETLLQKDKELQLLERITQLSKTFLKIKSEKK